MKLEPTSERVIEDTYKKSDSAYVVYLFHLATYRYAAQFTVERRVLDLGCGSGYGTRLFADDAHSVIGVDVADDAVAYANEHYVRDNLQYKTIPSDGSLPFADASFDVVTSFQVIEHVVDLQRYVSEARRMLAPGGLFIVVTPDRASRLFRYQKPWNPWHLTEFDAQGLKSALTPQFNNVTLLRMGGAPQLVDMEIRRYARMRLLSLPFTLPLTPEWLRQRALKSISRMRAQRAPQGLTHEIESLTQSDVIIGADIFPSVNVIALART